MSTAQYRYKPIQSTCTAVGVLLSTGTLGQLGEACQGVARTCAARGSHWHPPLGTGVHTPIGE